MPLSWLSIVDGVLGATDVIRWVRGRSSGEGDSPRGSTRLEARLASVVVSALKEAFDRDHQRVEFERQRLEEERERADRLLRLEWLRQAGEREIGRLRLLAGVSAATWLSTLLLTTRLTDGGTFGRVMLGLGWALLLTALAAAFSAQSHIARELGRMDDQSSVAELSSVAGAAVLWLIVAGLATIASGVLFV
jgi:hypothetical protein